jgi:uncharacterized protein (DUF1778 family)
MAGLVDRETSLAVGFDGPTLRAGDTGEPIATLCDDGLWRTPDGVVTEGLELPPTKLRPAVAREAITARNREVDAAWLEAAIAVIERLTRELAEFTTDEVWERLEHPPREGRQLGALMNRCQRAGLIAATEAHRPSTRPNVNRRPIRIWRSLVHHPER